jgi:hypothetical protein
MMDSVFALQKYVDGAKKLQIRVDAERFYRYENSGLMVPSSKQLLIVRTSKTD